MQSSPKNNESETFLNDLLRKFILKQISKYFELKNSVSLSFQRKDKYISVLEIDELKLQPLFFYENYLPLELKFSHIDKLYIEINDADSLNIKVVIQGVYIDLRLIDSKLDEVQERLRWIGIIFESASNDFNEGGNNFLKTKLRRAFQNKFWSKLQFCVKDLVISLDTDKKFSFGLTSKLINLETNQVMTKNMTTPGEDCLCKTISFSNVTLFAFNSGQLNLENLKEPEIKKTLASLLSKMTYYDMFTSDLLKKFTPGAMNVPCSGEINLITRTKRSDIMSSTWTVEFKITQFSMSLSMEYIYSILKYIKTLLQPFEIYSRIRKVKNQYIEFNEELQEKAQAIAEMFQGYLALREKLKAKYLSKKSKRKSEIIKIEEFVECFSSKKQMEGFKNLLLSLEFETLFAAIRSAFLLTSKVDSIDEKNLKTIFLSEVLPEGSENRQALFTEISKFYRDFLEQKELYNKEESYSEQIKVEFKVKIDKFQTLLIKEPGEKPEKIGEISFKEILFYHSYENWTNMKFKMLIKNIELNTRLVLMPFLKLTRGEITNKETLKNLIDGQLNDISVELLQKEVKNNRDMTISLNIGELTLNEKIYLSNYANNSIIERVSNDCPEPRIQISIDLIDQDGSLSINEVSINLNDLKVNDVEKFYSYFGGYLDKLPKYMKKEKIKFSKEVRLEITTDQVYTRIIRLFQMINGESLAAQEISKLEGLAKNQQLFVEEAPNKYTPMSTEFDSYLEISFIADALSIRKSIFPLKVTVNSQILMHLLSENSFLLEKAITSDHVIFESLLEKVTIVWLPSTTDIKMGTSCFNIQIKNLYTKYLKQNGVPNWKLSMEDLEIDSIEYYNSKTCVNKRIFGPPIEPLILPNTDFNQLGSLSVPPEQPMENSKSLIFNHSTPKVIEINLQTDEKGIQCFMIQINEPKVLVAFSLLEKWQETHQLFNVIQCIGNEFSKLKTHWSEKIMVKDFILYMPANTKVADDVKKIIALSGNVEYTSDLKSYSRNIEGGFDYKREASYNVKSLEVFMTSYGEFKQFSIKKDKLSRRVIMTPLSFELAVSKNISMFKNEDLDRVIKEKEFYALKDLEIHLQVAMNDLGLLYETITQEFSHLSKLKADNSNLGQSSLMKSNPYLMKSLLIHEEGDRIFELKTLNIHMSLLNDFEEGYSFPEVESKLLIKEGKINKASYLLEGKFKLHFFSLASKQWEPVIEQFGFVLGPDKKHETKVSFFNLDVSQDKEIKLTLTEDFLEFLTKAYVHFETKYGGQQRVSLMHDNNLIISNQDSNNLTSIYTPSPYIVRNFSGFDLEIEDSGQRKTILDGHTEKISKSTSLEKSVLLDMSNFVVYLRVKFPKESESRIVCTLSLDHQGVQKLPLTFISPSTKFGYPFLVAYGERKGYHIITTITPSILFENRLSQDLTLQLKFAGPMNKNPKESIVPSNGVKGISMEDLDSDIVAISSAQGWTIKEDFQALISMPNFSFKTYVINNKVMVIRKFQKPNLPGIYLTMEVGLQIKNLIPLPMKLQVSNGKNVKEFILNSNTHIVLDEFIDIHNCFLKIQLPNSSWTQEQVSIMDLHMMLQEDKSTTFSNKITRGLTLKDSNRLGIPIKITCLKENPHKLYIHTDTILIDKSTVESISYCQEVIHQEKTYRFPVTIGLKIALKNQSKKDHKTFIMHPMYPLRISTTTKEEELSEKLQLSHDTPSKEVKIEYLDGDRLVSLPLKVVLSSSILDVETEIESQIYTIYPSYAFYNKTNFILVVQTSSKTSLVNPGDTLPLEWLKSSEEYLCFSLFEIIVIISH